MKKKSSGRRKAGRILTGSLIVLSALAAIGLYVFHPLFTEEKDPEFTENPDSLLAIMQNISVKTAEKYPDGFALKKISRWNEDFQETKTIIVSGDPYYEITLYCDLNESEPSSILFAKTESGKLKSLYAQYEEGQWILKSVSEQDAVYENTDSAPAVNILNALSLDSFSIIEQFSQFIDWQEIRQENDVLLCWKVADQNGLIQAVSEDPAAGKMGNTLGNASAEVTADSDYCLQSSVIVNEGTDVTPTRITEVSADSVETQLLRDPLNKLFSIERYEEDPVDLTWIDQIE